MANTRQGGGRTPEDKSPSERTWSGVDGVGRDHHGLGQPHMGPTSSQHSTTERAVGVASQTTRVPSATLPTSQQTLEELETRLAEAERRASAAESKVRAVCDRYDALARIATHISWTTSPEGVVDDAPLWRAYTGQTREEVRGWGWLDAVHPHDRTRTLVEWQQAVRHQQLYETEYRVRRADGIYRTFLVRGVPVREPDGAIREWVGSCVDIEEHKLTQQALDAHLGDMDQLHTLVTRISGQDVRPLLDSVLRAVVELQHASAGVLALYDPVCEELTTATSIGFSEEFLSAVGRVPKGAGASGRAVAEDRPVVVPDIREDAAFAPYLPAAQLAGYRAVYCLPLRRMDGSILGTLSTYFTTPHCPSQRDTALAEIHARNAALLIEQAQLVASARDASAEATTQAGRLTSIFETITDGLFMYDSDGNIQLANAGARRMFGLDDHSLYPSLSLEQRRRFLRATDLTGRPLNDDRAHPVSRMLRGETIDSEHAEEMIIRLPKGVRLVVSISGAPVRGENGQITGAAVLLRDVSARHALEREAKARASQLEAMFGAMTDGAVLIDVHGRITYMNAAGLDCLGVDAQATRAYFRQSPEKRMTRFHMRDTQGRPFATEDLPQHRVLHGEVLAGQSLLVARVRMPTGEFAGQDRHWAFSGAPIRDESGKIVGGVIIFRDVTAYIQLQQEVSARATELEAILETVPSGVVVFNKAGDVVRLNPEAQAIFQSERHGNYFTSERVARNTLLQVEDVEGNPIPPERYPAIRALQGEVMVGASSVDVRCRLPGGPMLDLNVSGAPIRDVYGEITGAVLAVHDVGARRKLLDHTRESLAALVAMAEVMVAGDQTETHQPAQLLGLHINPVTQRLALLAKQVLGCERVGIVALDARDRMMPIAAVGLTGEQLPRWWAGLEGASIEHFIGAERLACLRGGEQVLLPLNLPPLRTIAYGGPTALATPLIIGGQLVGSMAIDYDVEPHEYTDEERTLAHAIARLAALVVERDRLERERAEAQANSVVLEETNRRMQEFLSVAGHELKTPVTVIKANAQMLARWSARNGGLNPREAEMLARTERQVARLMRLVNDLLDVTHIREGRLDLRLDVCDLRAIAREAVEEQRQINPMRQIRLHLPTRLVPVRADADRIGQVVTNYLTNALKYSREERPVQVGISVDGASARVSVRDSGPGIPADETSTIWEVFRRVPGVDVLSGSGVGLGLGLYISQEIVERHGGDVGVESVVGTGSTFWFALPLARPEDESHPTHGDHGRGAEYAQSEPGKPHPPRQG